MRRVYIAGPMNPRHGGGAIEYLRNCSRMIDAARDLIKAGFAPFCPAVDMAYFLGGPDDAAPTAAEIKAYSLAWMDACDCVLLMPGWRSSKGTLVEIQEAKRIGLPIFNAGEMARCIEWLKGRG